MRRLRSRRPSTGQDPTGAFVLSVRATLQGDLWQSVDELSR